MSVGPNWKQKSAERSVHRGDTLGRGDGPGLRDADCGRKAAGFSRTMAGAFTRSAPPECKRKFDDHPDYFIQEEAKRALGLIAEKE